MELSTCIDWLTYYVENKYYKRDPFKVNPSFVKPGIYYLPNIYTKSYEDIRIEAWRKFGIYLYFNVVEKSKTGNILYGFGGEIDEKSFAVLLMNEMSLLKRFVRYFQREVDPIFRGQNVMRANIADEVGPAYFEEPALPIVTLSPEKRLLALNCFEWVDSVVLNVKFTRQEMNCMRLMLEDYTASKIAEKLQISRRTAEYHVGKLKLKLSCSSKSELLWKLEQARMVGVLH